jgi:hypothetical protein
MAAPNSKERAAMATTSMLEARVDVLALAVECIASSLAGYQANEAAAVFRDGLSRHLTERGQVSAEVDEALAVQAGLLLRALGRSGRARRCAKVSRAVSR